MDAVGKLLNQSQGRDRVFRATQYACAFSVYLLRNKSQSKELVAKLKSLEANMSAGRKPIVCNTVTFSSESVQNTWVNLRAALWQQEVFRLGNTVNSIEAAKRTVRLSDRVLSLCLTAANLSRALYFLCDNTLWAQNVRLISHIDKERWSLNASRFYLVSLVMNLTTDLYFIVQLMTQKAKDKDFRRQMESHLSECPEVAEVVVPRLDALVFLLLSSLKSDPTVALDTLKNICDLFIPLDKLGIYKSNAGVVGFCGLVSSLIGLLTVLQPKLKIKT